MSVSEKIVGLRIAARKAVMCENIDGAKNTLSLRTKILYLLRGGALSPVDIMDTLMIAKTNVALITGQMATLGLLQKQKPFGDKREVVYVITDEGREYLEKRLDIIEQAAKKSFSNQDEYKNAEEKLEEALNVFSFMQ